MVVRIDEMLKEIGEFRQYQWFLMFLFGYFVLTGDSFNTLIVTFITAEPDWKCVDGYMNNTVCKFNESITLTSDDYKARCEMPREAWTFVDDFTSIVTEYDLVCDDSILLSVAQSSNWVGMLTGLLIGGYLSDKYGRRRTTMFGHSLNVFASLAMVFPKSYIVFVVCRIAIGFGAGFAASPSFLLLTEYTTEKYRSSLVFGHLIFWQLGLVVLPLIGYFTPDWRMFLLTTVLCGVPSLLLIWLIPESPRWLLLNSRENEARNQLLKVAKMNKRILPDDELEKPVISHNRASFRQLFSSWKMTKTTLINWNIWFTHTFAFYGVSFGTVDLGGNRYLNFFLVNLVGLPSYFAVMWSTNRFGRKKSVVFSLFITVIASAISVSIPPNQNSVIAVGGRVTAAVIANFFIISSFSCVYLWSSELFPTVIRATGMSTSSSVGRIGSFAASYVIWLIRIHRALPYSIMGAICLQAAILACFLPETKGAATLETMDDMKIKKEQELALVVNGASTTAESEKKESEF